MSNLHKDILKEHINDFVLTRIDSLVEDLKINKSDDSCRYNQLKNNLDEIYERIQDENLRDEIYNIFSELLSKNTMITYQYGFKDGIKINSLV